MPEGGGIGDGSERGELEHPRQRLGTQRTGTSPWEWGRLEPPGASDGGTGAGAGHRQGGRFDLPRHLVSQPESVVSTVATLTRGIPLASRDAASCAESFVHVDSTREQRDTLDLQNFTSQSPDVAPVAACVRCSKFCARRAVVTQLVSMAKYRCRRGAARYLLVQLRHCDNAAHKGRLSCTEG